MKTSTIFIITIPVLIITLFILCFFLPTEEDKEIKEFTKIIDKDPNNGEAYFNRGKAYFDRKSYKKALADFDIALKRDPEIRDALFYSGCAYIGMEEWDRAIEDLSIYLVKPSSNLSFMALERRGYAFLKIGEYDKAFKDCNNAIKIYPGYFPAIATSIEAQKALYAKRGRR